MLPTLRVTEFLSGPPAVAAPKLPTPFQLSAFCRRSCLCCLPVELQAAAEMSELDKHPIPDTLDPCSVLFTCRGQSTMARKAERQKFEAAGHIVSRVRKLEMMSVLSSLSLFYSVGDPSPWNGTVHSEGGPSHLT